MKQYFTTHLHVSWMLAAFCAALVIGIVGAGSVPQGQFSSNAWLLTGIGLFLTGVWRQKAVYIVLVVIGGLTVGVWRGSVTLDDLGPYDTFLGKTVTLKGVIAEDPELNKRGQTVLRIAVSHVNNHEIGGFVWMTTSSKGAIARSDVVTAQATLSEGFGQFSVIAPVANILILPLVPLAMLLTFIAGIAGLIFGNDATAFGVPAEILLTYMTNTASYMGNLPWAVQQLSINTLGAIGMFIAIGAACVYMTYKTKFSLHSTSLVE